MIWILQNADFEEPGAIVPWLRKRRLAYSVVRVHEHQPLPAAREEDGVIVLGHPASVNDLSAEPALREEEAFLRDCLEKGTRVFGICFGAQLLARLLGGKVSRAARPEVGWQRVDFHPSTGFPAAPIFQWHGEEFTLPPGARLLARSEATAVQGFRHGRRVAAFAGHPEMTAPLLEKFVARCWSEEWYQGLEDRGFVQTPAEMRRLTPGNLAPSEACASRLFRAWLHGYLE